MPSTFERLVSIIGEQHHVDTSALAPASGLADAGLDSLAVAELLFAIEDTFSVNLGDMDPHALPGTLGELVTLIDGQLKADIQPA